MQQHGGAYETGSESSDTSVPGSKLPGERGRSVPKDSSILGYRAGVLLFPRHCPLPCVVV